jgi:hypothetical protein
MDTHEQVWAKVNAPVDRGVADLVAALSEFPGLETVESCEGGADRPAWICFRYGRYWQAAEPWRETAEFVLGHLAPQLYDRVGDSATITLRPRGDGDAIADLTVRPEAKVEVQAALIAIAAGYQRRPTP